MIPETKNMGRTLRFLPIFIFILFSSNSFAGSPNEKSRPEGAFSQPVFTRSIVGQALINSDPRNPEGYRLLAASQNAASRWVELVRTAENAEQNGVFDSFLYQQKAIAFLALGDYRENYFALVMAEKLARDNDK